MHTSVRPASVRSAEMSNVCCQPRWTPPMPPVAMKWMPAIAHAASVPATVVAPHWPETAHVARSRPETLRTSSVWASRSMSSSSSPTLTAPSMTAMVAGTAPRSRTRCCASLAAAGPMSGGRPWAITDDSSATTGCDRIRARSTSAVIRISPDGCAGHRRRSMFLHHDADATLADVSSVDPGIAAPVTCANHPKVETGVSCSNCGKPICPDCMVPAPVGIKCRDCARQPRSARVDAAARPGGAGRRGRAGRRHRDGRRARVRGRRRPWVLHVHPRLGRRPRWPAGRRSGARAATAAPRRAGSPRAARRGRT